MPGNETQRTGGRFWRFAILIVIGILALFAAVPLAEFLHEQLWTMHYDNVLKRYGRGYANGPPYRIIAIEDPEEAGRNNAIHVFIFLLPILFLLILAARRANPWVGVLLIFLMPCALISLFQLTERHKLSEQEFTFIAIVWLLVGLIITILLALRQGLLPRPMNSTSMDAEPAQSSGIGRNPWKTWLILAVGFIALQAAVPVAEYLTAFIWDILNDYQYRGDGYGYYHDVVDREYDYYFEGLRYALYSGFLYVIPFVFLALAIRWNMKPWTAIVFGLLCGVCLTGVIFTLEYTYYIYKRVSFAILVSQFFAVIGYLLLASYHQRVSKIQFESEDDFSD